MMGQNLYSKFLHISRQSLNTLIFLNGISKSCKCNKLLYSLNVPSKKDYGLASKLKTIPVFL